jgi:putative SOS response-associated peptidase YedK
MPALSDSSQRILRVQPFHFGMKDNCLFSFAGRWDRWKPPKEPAIESCAILTTAPNELLRDVHDRMPVILRADKYQAWLDVPASERGDLRYLLIPFDSAIMKRFPVGWSANDVQNDTPECIRETPEFISVQAALL